MAFFIARRFLAAAVALFAILTLAFCVTRLMPGNAYDDPGLGPDVAEALKARAHLDKPIPVQYTYFLRGILLSGDWGTSTKIEPGSPVFSVLARRIPTSLMLSLPALMLALPIGLALGLLAAVKKGSALDCAISVGVVICISVPSFVFASLLQYTLAYKLGLFPILFEPSALLALRLKSMLLPVFALMLHPIAAVARYLRGELSELAPSEFIALARTKGMTIVQAMLRHGLRNAAIPMMSVILPMFAQLVGGSMVIERLFSIPGVGGALIGAISSGDHALAVASLVFYAAVSITVTLITDICYGLADPRVKVGEKRK